MQDLISFIMIMGGSIVSIFGVLAILIFFVLINIYNEVHRSKYNELMAYLEEHHNEIYEEIRIKPILGLYPKGAYRKSMLYAKDHPPLDDPIAEKLFSEYAEISWFNPKAFWDHTKDIFSRRDQLIYNNQDIRTGVIIGITIGLIVGAIIGNIDLPFPLPIYETPGTLYGAIIGSLGGLVGGAYSSVREFSWEMSPLQRAVFGAFIGAISWVMAISVFLSISGIFT